ncbi:MAG TPA: WYL domain-containing protein, partial [Solirubrobacteraceae bacterium]|nr:WYL domain-containing protein [Solirubrobacteraceae bacterium]
ETAIFRNKTILFDYYTMERDEQEHRKVDPYHLIFQGGQFYLLGLSHERKAIRVFRLSRIRGKVSYATKAEHDFRRPADFDPRAYANRSDWQLGEELGVAEIQISERIAWQVERHFGRYGEIRHDDGETVFLTSYSNTRGILSWVLGLGGNARLLGPDELVAEFDRRLELLEARHRDGALGSAVSGARFPSEGHGSAAGGAVRGSSRAERRADKGEGENGRAEAAIRPERFARLVTLASILIRAGRAGEPVSAAELRERLQLSDEELREDVNVLNVVNFGGGSYVLYAEINDNGEIEVDPEPYSDNFDRPARLLPVEAKALVAAIDLIGEHLPEGSLTSAREKIVAALGEDPMDQGLQVAPTGADDSDVARRISKAIAQHKLIELEYYKENEDELTSRTVEPYALTNGREGWYVASFDPARDGVRHFRLDRIKEVSVASQKFKPRPEVDPAAEVDGWLRTGEVPASAMARVWVSPERARWAREARRVVGECRDGAVIVELGFAGVDWLVREILKEAGDAAVIEPEEAREAVLAAVARVREASGAAAVA